MLVDDLRLETRAGQAELSGRVTMDGYDTEDLRIWFRFPEHLASGQLDASPFVPALLVTAMFWNEALVIEAPISRRLKMATVEAIDAYRDLFPTLPPITIDAPTQDLPPATDATACLFSRGVDSWYSALSNLERPDPRRPRLTHLVYIPSIDFMYGPENRAHAIESTRRAAESIGCELVLVETNLRELTERFQHWGVTFGGGLSGAALAIGAGFSHVLLPASVPLRAPNRSGSHAALDPLWSTERTSIVHDGPISRLEKVRLLADHPEALANLKVCFVEDTPRNCGRCEKCLATMLELHVAGVLDQCAGFDRPIDRHAVAKIGAPGWQRDFLVELIDALGGTQRDRALRRALERVLLREDVRASVRRASRIVRSRLAPLRARFRSAQARGR